MNILNSLFVKLLSLTFLSSLLISCIKDEALNAEADILKCSIHNEYIKSEPIITNDMVVVLALPHIDRTRLAPTFELTPGAKISPASGTIRDFTNPQEYTVTSEDENWQKTYKFSVDTSDLFTEYHFENSEIKGKYEVFFETITSGSGISFRQNIWATANPGYALTGLGNKPEDYPTLSQQGGVSQKCVKLETKSTGKFGMDLKPTPMPIAAGNLFIGSFDASKAMKEPMEATHFGLPFGKEPKTFTGYYKFKAGNTFTDPHMNILPGRKDMCDIYAVLYETDENLKYLDGNTILTHPNIIALARIGDAHETDEWTPFELTFEYRKPVDPQKLKNYKYNLAVVFTSSIKGNIFEGAVGSTLYIDEARIICK